MDAGRVGRGKQRPSLRRPAVVRAAFFQGDLSGLQIGRYLRRRDKDFGEDIEGWHTGSQHAGRRIGDEASRAADVGERTLTREWERSRKERRSTGEIVITNRVVGIRR